MNIFKIITLLITFSLLLNACCSQKEKPTPSKETVVPIQKKSKKEMLSQGYIQAAVIYDKEKTSPCRYLIKINDKMYLEPLRELKSDFKNDNQLIWIKYHPQRRMSRCGNAQTVEITGIERR